MAQIGMKNNWNKLAPSLLAKCLPLENKVNQCAIICELVKKNVHSSEVRDSISLLKSSSSVFWKPYLVSDFAIAALHILGMEEYTGNREEIKALISSGLNFL